MRTAGFMFILGLAAAAGAQENSRGPLFEARFDGTVNELGVILRFDPTAGYRLNRYAAVEAGVPFYFVRPSETALPSLGAASGAALGNAHFALRLRFANPALNYEPSLTVTAPTGDEARGLSTGKVTWDLNNLLHRSFGRVTPYASLGAANTVSDTPLFVRPFTSHGLVGHVEGGALLALAGPLSFGASLYAIAPSGEQTVVSRVFRGAAQSDPPGQGRSTPMGRGRDKQGVFESAPETQGPAGIARDRGGSLWITAGTSQGLEFHAGYTRSFTFALDTLSFGAAVRFGK